MAAFMGCGEDATTETESEKTIYLGGTLIEYAGEYVYIIDSRNCQGYRNYMIAIDSALVDTAGNFELTIAPTNFGYYQFKDKTGWNVYYGSDLYLKPGDSMVFNQTEDTTTITGSGAVHNAFWAYYQGKIESNQSATIDRWLNWGTTGIIAGLDSLREAGNGFLQGYIADLDEGFVNFAQKSIEYQYKNELIDFMQYYSYYAGREYVPTPFDSLGINRTDYVGTNESDWTFIRNYQRYVGGVGDLIMAIENEKLPDSIAWENQFQRKHELICNTFTGVDKDIALASEVNNFYSYMAESDSSFYAVGEMVLQQFSGEYTSEVMYDSFRNTFNKYQKIAPGQPAPQLTLPDTAGNMISLQDYQGSLIYLDFWGTWCGPCRAEMPNSAQLHHDLEGTDVVFVYVGLQSADSHQEWIDYIADENIMGEHMFAEGQFGNEEIKPFMIRAAPTYMLIGRDGNIISPSAPRPGSALEYIQEHL